MERTGRDSDKKVVPDTVLLELSRKITGEWKNVARYLNVEEGDIDHIVRDNDHNAQEQIYQMLLFWKKKEGQKATFTFLKEALKQALREDLAVDLNTYRGKSKKVPVFICLLLLAVAYMYKQLVPATGEKELTNTHSIKPKENSLQWFEFMNDNLLTIGGVMIKPNQLVHLSFVKNKNGVVLNCFDPHNPDEQYWQYVEERVDRNVPIVMSRRAIFYDGTSHVLFAAGNKVFVVHLHLTNNLYTAVDSVSVLTMDVADPPGTWISSIFGHQPTAVPCEEFLLTVSSSTKLFVYSAFGKVKQIIDIKDARPSHIHLSRVAFRENNFAIVDSSSENIILMNVEGKVKQFSPLKPPVSGFVPLDVICTGVRWLVLYVSNDNEQNWMVATYKTKHTEDFKINNQGTFWPNLSSPVSVTHSQKNGYVTFVNGTVQHFRFGTWT